MDFNLAWKGKLVLNKSEHDRMKDTVALRGLYLVRSNPQPVVFETSVAVGEESNSIIAWHLGTILDARDELALLRYRIFAAEIRKHLDVKSHIQRYRMTDIEQGRSFGQRRVSHTIVTKPIADNF